jgi:predicted metalloprotease with PDZ domain
MRPGRTFRALRALALAASVPVVVTTLPGGVPCCELSYELKPDPGGGVVDVTLEIHGFHGDTLVLTRPSSRPLVGLLGQDPVVEGVPRESWGLVGGQPRWSYARPEDGWSTPIRVDYRLTITSHRPLNAWSVGLDRDLLYAPSEALFLLPSIPEPATRNARVEVQWDLPRGWRSFTGWSGDVFYGTRRLLKTNILAGDIEHREASACGLQIEIAVYGEWTFDPADLATDMGRLACAARYRLGPPTSERYAVTLVPARFPMTSGNRNGPSAIGFVHLLPDGSPPPTRLLAHELVHQWQRFDSEMWFHEGVNDYMGMRLANEAGLIDDARLAELIAGIDSIYRSHPRSRDWTFADETRDALPFGPSDEYLGYRKGALVGLALDRELRLRTGGEADLAALWRDMNKRAAWGHVRWSDAEIAELAAAHAGGSTSRFFAQWVDGTEPLSPPERLLAGMPSAPVPPAPPRGLGAVAAFLEFGLGLLFSSS